MNKYYITTALPYVNAPPHLGFALEIIQADVLARYHRLLGETTLFLTGTDEHGAKNAQAAQKQNKSPEEFTNEISSKFKALTRTLNISNDDFIRTTDKKRHWPTAKMVWQSLEKRGDLYKKKYEGLYCVGHEAFITRKDLAEGKCSLHLLRPEKIDEENYFFRLSQYAKKIEQAISTNKIKIFPESRKKEMLAFIKEGLEDVSFSRPSSDLKWGIPVPNDENHTMYVWCDALTNYISALDFARGSAKFKRFWPADVHCIGKDILRFHAIIWPGMLMALGLALPKTIFVHGLITVGGQKMSKTIGNVIDPFELVAKYGVDPVRYYLLREIPSTEDGDYTRQKFEQRYNADLARGLGNLVARVITLGVKFEIKNSRLRQGYGGQTKFKIIINTTGSKQQNSKIIDSAWEKYRKSLDEFKFNDVLSAIWSLIGWCDKYIEKERPWEGKNQQVIHDLLFSLANIASMLGPFMPETSKKIFGQLGIGAADKRWRFRPRKAESLFPRLK